jgi:hypothetical protein
MQRRDDPRARLYIVDHTAPGSTIRRRVEVSNMTSTRQEIAVYAAAAEPREGAFTIADGRTSNELTTWVSLDPAAVDLPAGGRKFATATIKIPPTASPGERYGVIWAELGSTPPDRSGVTVVNRVGIRMYLSVGPGGEPASDFHIDSLAAARTADGQPTVRAQVSNTGQRALDLGGELQLTDGPGGLDAGPFPAELGTTLAVGATEPVVVRLDKRLPDGPWQAHLELRSGLTHRTAEATLKFPSAGSAEPVTPQETPTPVLIALCAAALIALLATVRKFGRLSSRRRRTR